MFYFYRDKKLSIMFSKSCEYGIKASCYIALQSLNDKRVQIQEIASRIDSPEAFTAKILQQMVKNNIVESVKGPYGGFEIKKENLNKIKLNKIVTAIDGDAVYNGCALGFKECSSLKPCPLHKKIITIRKNLKDMLENTSLLELATSLDKGMAFLKIANTLEE